jgi:hypothetical protein
MALVDCYNQGNLVHSGKEVFPSFQLFALCNVRTAWRKVRGAQNRNYMGAP